MSFAVVRRSKRRGASPTNSQMPFECCWAVPTLRWLTFTGSRITSRQSGSQVYELRYFAMSQAESNEGSNRSTTFVKSSLEQDPSNVSAGEDEASAVNHKVTVAGQQLGAFVLQEEIGRGGMGVVYRATQKALDRTVALKVLPLAAQLNQERLQRFKNESRAAAQLQHPHIVPLYDVGQDDGTHYFSMRYIDGINLGKLIKTTKAELSKSQQQELPPSETPADGFAETIDLGLRRGNVSSRDSTESKDGGISLCATDFQSAAKLRRMPTNHRLTKSVARVGISVADALQCAHDQGIIHRDIKPSNLMLDQTGKVWVTDFGLAIIRSSPSLTQSGMILGTLRYMSPEQASGQRRFIDHRTDIFSLGITLYELITLQHAFDGNDAKDLIRQVTLESPPPLRNICPSIPDDLVTIIEKSFERNPDDRYQSAGDLADDLQRFLNNEPIKARQPSLSRRFRQWCTRNERLATAGFMFLVSSLLISVMAGGAILAALSNEKSARQHAEDLLSESEARRMLTRALLEVDTNPGRAQAMALMGMDGAPGPEANETLLTAYDRNHELLLTTGQAPFVGNVALSPDGNYFAEISSQSASDNQSIIAIKQTSDGSLVKILATESTSPSLKFGETGRVLCVVEQASNPKTVAPESLINIWSMPSLKKISSISSTAATASQIGLSLIDDRAAIPVAGGYISIIDTTNGKQLFRVSAEDSDFFQTRFSPDGQYLLAVATSGQVHLFDSKEGKRLGEAAGSNRPTKDDSAVKIRLDVVAQFSADSKHVVVTSGSGVRIYPIIQDQEDATTALGAYTVARPERRTEIGIGRNVGLLFAPYSPSLRVTDIPSGDALVSIDADFMPYAVHLLSGGTVCLAVDLKKIVAYSTLSGLPLASLDGHSEQITSVAGNAKTSKVISADFGGNIRIWSLRSGLERRSTPIHKMLPAAIRLSDSAQDTEGETSSLMGPVVANQSLLLQSTDLKQAGQTFEGQTCRAGNKQSKQILTFHDDTLLVTDVQTQRVTNSIVPGGKRIFCAKQIRQGIALISTLDNQLFWYDTNSDRLRVLGKATILADNVPVSANADRFAYSTDEGLTIICSAESGEELFRSASPHAIRGLCFHPTRGTLFVASQGNRISELDERGRPTDFALSTEESTPSFYWISFSSDGSRLLTWPFGLGKATAWDDTTGKQLLSKDCPTATSIRQHPTKSMAIMFSKYGGAWLWDFESDGFTQLSDQRIVDASFADEKIWLLLESGTSAWPKEGSEPSRVSSFAGIRAYNIPDGTQDAELQLKQHPRQLDLSDDGKTIVVTLDSYGVSLFDQKLTRPSLFVGNHDQPPIAASFNNDGTRVTTISKDGRIETFDKDGNLLHARTHQPDLLATADISDDGSLAITGGTDGSLLLWTLSDASDPISLDGHNVEIQQVAFCGNANRLAAADISGAITVRDLRTQKVIKAFEEDILHLSLTPDGSQMALVTGLISSTITRFGGTVVSRAPKALILLKFEQDTRTVLEPETNALSTAFSSDGSELIVVRNSGQVSLIGNDGQTKHDFRSIDQPLTAAAFVDGGKQVVTAGGKNLTVWDSQTGVKLYELPSDGLSLAANGADWSPAVESFPMFNKAGSYHVTQWPLNIASFARPGTRALTKKELSALALSSSESINTP